MQTIKNKINIKDKLFIIDIMAITSRPPTQSEINLFRSADPSKLPKSINITAITSRPPTQAETNLFRSVDPSKLPQPSVTITPSGPSQSSGYVSGGSGSVGGGSRSRPKPKPVVYTSSILQQSFTSEEAREKAEKQFFQQQRQSTIKTTKPTEKAVLGTSTIRDVRQEDVYREPFFSRVKSSSVGQKVSSWGTGLSRVGQDIFEIGGKTVEKVKEAKVTPRSAYFGLRYDLSKTELGSVDWKEEELDLGLPQPVKAKVPVPRYTDEQLSATRTGAEILIERDKDLLTQQLLTVSDNSVKAEQKRLDNFSIEQTKQFEDKWADKVSGGYFTGTAKEFEQYKRESKQLEQVFEIELKKSRLKVDKEIDTTADKLIEQFEKKSGERINKGEITQAVGRSPIYFGLGVATAGTLGGVSAVAGVGTALKTAGIVGLGATAITGYKKGLEGDYTSVATMGITTGAFLAGGLTYAGVKAGQVGYTKAQLKKLQKGIDVGRGITVDRTLTGVKIVKTSTIKTITGTKKITLQRDLKFSIDPKKPFMLQDTGVGRDVYKIRGIFGQPKTITQDFRFSFNPQKIMGKFSSGGSIKGISTRTWTQYGKDVKVFEGRGFGYKLKPTKAGESTTLGAEYKSYKYKPVVEKVSAKDGVLNIQGRFDVSKGYVDRFKSIIKIRSFTSPKSSDVKWVQPADIKKTPFKDTFQSETLQVQQFKSKPITITSATSKTIAGLTTGIKPAPLRSLIISQKPLTATFQTAGLISGLKQKPLPVQDIKQDLSILNIQKPTLSSVFKQAQGIKLNLISKSTPITTPFLYSDTITQLKYPPYRSSIPSIPSFKFPKRQDSMVFGKKGKVFKQKGITKMYQASVGSIALNYGVTEKQYKDIRGKQFTGLELRPVLLPQKKGSFNII